jgi:hypothetical protein
MAPTSHGMNLNGFLDIFMNQRMALYTTILRGEGYHVKLKEKSRETNVQLKG